VFPSFCGCPSPQSPGGIVFGIDFMLRPDQANLT
jgi:hypothetical protein